MRPVGQIFNALRPDGEIVRLQVVFIKTICIDEVPCRHCELQQSREYLDPYYDSGRLISACGRNVWGYNNGNFDECLAGRIFNEKVCFIDPADFNPDVHGIVATDDPLYIAEDFRNKKIRRIHKNFMENDYWPNPIWHHYHKYWYDHGKKFRFLGNYRDGDIDSAPPLTDSERQHVERLISLYPDISRTDY